MLKKYAQNKSYASGTGGGPPKVLPLTELEENLLEIVTLEAAGLENIPEGGNFNRTITKTCSSSHSSNAVSDEESVSPFMPGESRKATAYDEVHSCIDMATSMQMKRV